MRNTAIYPFFYLGLVLILAIKNLPASVEVLKHSSVPSHEIWSNTLERFVSEEGMVDYEGLSNSDQFSKYLTLLSNSKPNADNWTSADQLSFWINVYNAYSIKLIIDHFGVLSIKDIDAPWDREFIEINGITYSLGYIEHNILRVMGDPRIHFAIVCASKSCPILLNEAYEGSKIEEQLEKRTSQFINDNSRNHLQSKKVSLSKIFKWFRSDFTTAGSLISYVDKYSNININSDAELTFLEYDWRLNK